MVVQRAITGFFLISLLAFVYLYLPPLVLSCFFLVVGTIIIFIEWPPLVKPHAKAFWLLTPVYPIAPFIYLILLNQNPLSHPLIPYLFAIVFSFDTWSYIAGKLLGNTKICPTISPGKTWEGTIGGYVGTISLLIAWYWYQGITKPWLLLSFVIGLICALSLCGDLFESWLKRRAQVKDSGTLLPGHGGLLDRFDSILFVAPFFYVCKS